MNNDRATSDNGDEAIMPPANADKQPWETPRVTPSAVRDTTFYYSPAVS
jgi:hypothetical protein